jgi:hypothetical protein
LGTTQQIQAKIAVLDPEADEQPASDKPGTAAKPTGRKGAILETCG